MAFVDRGEFEAMKTLSGWEAYRCLNKSHNEERKKEYEKWHFCYRTLLRLAVFRMAFGHLYESC